MPRLTSVLEPASEPLTLAEAKTHLRVDTSDDDEYVNALIVAARNHVESITRRALITQTWDLYIDDFPGVDNPIELPKAPLQSVTSIIYVDENGDEQTLNASSYIVSTVGVPGRITPEYELDWPVTREIVDAVRIRFVAGYEDSGSSPQDLADNVPDAIKHAIKLIISHWYENREPVNIGNIITPLPMAIDALLAPYRVYTFY